MEDPKPFFCNRLWMDAAWKYLDWPMLKAVPAGDPKPYTLNRLGPGFGMGFGA